MLFRRECAVVARTGIQKSRANTARLANSFSASSVSDLLAINREVVVVSGHSAIGVDSDVKVIMH